MGLSSNTFWHQTEYYKLQSIISSKKINVNYSLEELKNSSLLPFNYAFPMISLSDIPLSEFGAHLNKYGGHSIGFKREWVVANGFSPVSYYSDRSKLLSAIIERAVYLKQNYYNLNSDLAQDFKAFIFQLAHSKNYEGELAKKDYKSYRFSDEREWRYVPSIELFDKGLDDFIILPDAYQNDRTNVDKKLKNMCKEFTFNDINYIIVEKDYQIEKIKNKMEEVFLKENPQRNSFPWEKINISFFTQKQIQNDIFGIAHDIKLTLK